MKQDLSRYSRSIITCDLDVEALLEGLRQGVVMASKPKRGDAAAGLSRSWGTNLAPIVEFLR